MSPTRRGFDALRLPAAILCGSLVAAQTVGPAGSMEGRVVDLTSGAPIPGAMVTLGLRNGRTLSAMTGARPTFPAIKTDQQGRFVFTNLEAGVYSLTAERQGFLRAGYETIGSHPVVLGENQALLSALLGLLPEGVIAAKVLDSDGDPLADALVRLLRQGNLLAAGRAQAFAAGSCRTDDLGECRVARLPHGNYLLEASPPPRPASSRSLPRSEKPEPADIVTYYPRAADLASAKSMRTGPGEMRVEMKLLKLTTVQISGRVIDPGPVAGTTVLHLAARNAAGSALQADTPADDGSFLIRNVPPGKYKLVAWHEKKDGLEQDLEVVVGKPIALDLVLEK